MLFFQALLLAVISRHPFFIRQKAPRADIAFHFVDSDYSSLLLATEASQSSFQESVRVTSGALTKLLLTKCKHTGSSIVLHQAKMYPAYCECLVRHKDR